MKLSKLIETLQKLEERWGDVDVWMEDSDLEHMDDASCYCLALSVVPIREQSY